MSREEADVTAPARSVRLRLEGTIDERADLDPIVELKADPVYLDLGHITHLNSAGVHRWVRFVETMTRTRRRVVLTRCSGVFTAHALMVPNMVAHTVLESVHLAYWCRRCDDSEELLVCSAAESPARRGCSRCRGPLELEASPAQLEQLFACR